MAPSVPAPPERLVLPTGAALHRLRVGDGPALREAVAASLEHLAPWMGWAVPGAADGDEQLELARGAETRWDDGVEHLYALREPDQGPLLGLFGLHHDRRPGAVEIGYWLHPAATGHGHARAATRALVEAALALPGVTRVEVVVDEANTASSAVARASGLRLERVEPREPQSPAQVGRAQVWVSS